MHIRLDKLPPTKKHKQQQQEDEKQSVRGQWKSSPVEIK